jgi:hypothetical protein
MDKNPFEIDNSFRRSLKPNPYDDELIDSDYEKRAVIAWFAVFWVIPIVYFIFQYIIFA